MSGFYRYIRDVLIQRDLFPNLRSSECTVRYQASKNYETRCDIRTYVIDLYPEVVSPAWLISNDNHNNVIDRFWLIFLDDTQLWWIEKRVRVVDILPYQIQSRTTVSSIESNKYESILLLLLLKEWWIRLYVTVVSSPCCDCCRGSKWHNRS